MIARDMFEKLGYVREVGDSSNLYANAGTGGGFNGNKKRI